MQKKKILGLMTKSVGLSVSLQDPLGFVFVFPCCVQTQPCCWWMEAAEVKRPWELEAHSPWQTLEAFSPICTPRWIWIQDLIWTFFGQTTGVGGFLLHLLLLNIFTLCLLSAVSLNKFRKTMQVRWSHLFIVQSEALKTMGRVKHESRSIPTAF